MKKTAIILSLSLCAGACRETPEAYDVWPDWGEEMPDPMVINGAESDETPYEGQPAWNLDLVDGQQLASPDSAVWQECFSRTGSTPSQRTGTAM